MASLRRGLDIKRFAALADSYGSDLQRWPAASRDGAALLLSHSATARMILKDAEQLDGCLLAASGSDARSSSAQDAPLARLRSGVSGRIATMPPARKAPAWRVSLAGLARRRPGPGRSPSLGWIGALGCSGIVVALGLFIGVNDVQPAPNTSLLAVLDPAQIPELGP